MPHIARSFQELPNQVEAPTLLEAIVAASCHPLVLTGMPLVLYGNGDLGKLAKEYLKSVGRDFVAVIERDEEADVNSCVAVSVVTSPYVPIERALLKRGFKTVVPFYDLTEEYREWHPLSNGWFAPNFTYLSTLRTNRVLNFWHDDISRAHHLQFIAWRRAREEWVFDSAPVIPDNRFFIPEIIDVLREDESFIDAGAHFGSVSRAFIKLTKGKFKHISAIEPDKFNREVLQNELPTDKRIKIWPYALSNVSGIANFHEGLGYSSQLSTTGKTYVITYPIDLLNLSPTFIKLHLEGTELAALKGAKRTLLTKRPIIAATVYHNEDGMWETPLWLMENLSDYRFLFRQHCWCGTGAVIYAIPEERYK